MTRIRQNINNNGGSSKQSVHGLDELDLMVLESLLLGLKGKEISMKLSRPLSTIQRRVRKLFESGAVDNEIKLDYTKLGMKRGNIFVSLRNGESKEVAARIARMPGMLSVSIHIGNTDLVGEFVYRNSADLLDLMEIIKNLDGVERAVWSEEVYRIPVKQVQLFASPFKGPR
jgi:DNA-binding Lrp family transcriptional regulator